MNFSSEEVSRHNDNLNAISDAAVDDFETYCNNLFADFDWDNADSKSLSRIRDQVIDHIVYIQETYGGASESIGSLFFENALATDNELADAVMTGAANNEQIQKSVRYWAKNLFKDEPDVEAFIRGCSSFVRRTISHAGDLTVADSASGSNKTKQIGVRFARVPQGPSCGFCIMLASRGFVYASKESAGQFKRFHDDCDCRIVAGMPGTTVEGYNPEEMYDRYKQCRDAITNGEVGSKNPVWRDWERLTPEEQNQYADDTGGDPYNNYLAHRIAQEMDTRDRQWLYDGSIPQFELEDGAEPSSREKDTAKRLAEHGYKSRFRPTRDLEMKRTSDVYFVSGKQGKEILVEWDFKGVEGNGSQTIYHQFEEAAGQTKNVVIDLKNAGSRYENKDYAIDRTEKFIKYHYTIKAGFNAGNEWVFEQAIILFKDGSIIKIAR